MSKALCRALPAFLGLALAACSGPREEAAFGVAPLAGVAGPESGQVRLSGGARGPLVMSWLEPEDDGYALKYARYEQRAWGAAERLAAGSSLFVNWADFPSVAPIDERTWAAHWLVRRDSPFAYDVVAAVSGDAGRSWNAPVVLNDDDTDTEHGFATLFAWDDTIGVVWLDGRRLADWTVEKELAAEVPLGTSLYFARLSLDGRVLERQAIDELVCDCCPTDVALGAQGPLLVYRDRTAEEIRDIVVRRHDGAGWSAPVEVGADGFEIDGCPVNGPSIEARGEDVAVAWFTAPGNRPKVRFARSRDGARSFEPAVDLDTAGAFGQVDLVLLDDSSAVVSWWRRAEQGGLALVARRVGADGALGPVRTIATSAVAQPLDMPQMARVDGGLVFAWTGVDTAAGVHSVYVTGL